MAVRVDEEKCWGVGACTDVCVVAAPTLEDATGTVLVDARIGWDAGFDECSAGELGPRGEVASPVTIGQDLGAIQQWPWLAVSARVAQRNGR